MIQSTVRPPHWPPSKRSISTDTTRRAPAPDYRPPDQEGARKSTNYQTHHTRRSHCSTAPSQPVRPGLATLNHIIARLYHLLVRRRRPQNAQPPELRHSSIRRGCFSPVNPLLPHPQYLPEIFNASLSPPSRYSRESTQPYAIGNPL